MPWFGPGDDVSPLDVFVNNALKDIIREKDVSNIVRLEQEAAAALQRMSDCPKFLDGLKKATESAEPRLRWIVANGGRKIPKGMKF